MNSEAILIHAPFGRDATVVAEVLKRAGFRSEVLADMEGLCERIRSGAGAVVVVDEALTPAGTDRFSQTLGQQEEWSGLPVIVLTANGEATGLTRFRLNRLEGLRNITLLERPLRTETALSAVNSALRTRRHQYRIRDMIEAERNTARSLRESEEHLRKTNAELAAANRELEEFAYASSHDLQEPLRAINIYTSLLTRKFERCLDDEGRSYADFVHKGVARMEVLLKDLLSLSGLMATEKVAGQQASLALALSQAVSALAYKIRESKAIVNAGAMPAVEGDQAQFERLFANLISNSVKYRKAGEPPCIEINAERHGDEWLIGFRDNGIGFEQEHAEKIFGLFKRLHRDEYPGTGVGLALCKRIVERNGGHIWAESEPGHGAAFFFTARSAEP